MKLPNKYSIYTHLKGIKARISIVLTHTRIESYTATVFQLRLSTSKAEKSNTSAKGCWEPL